MKKGTFEHFVFPLIIRNETAPPCCIDVSARYMRSDVFSVAEALQLGLALGLWRIPEDSPDTSVSAADDEMIGLLFDGRLRDRIKKSLRRVPD